MDKLTDFIEHVNVTLVSRTGMVTPIYKEVRFENSYYHASATNITNKTDQGRLAGP